MQMFSASGCVCAASLVLVVASTAHGSGFAFNPDPRTRAILPADVSDMDSRSGAGLLTVCGNEISLRPGIHNRPPILSPGCAPGALSADSLTVAGRIGLGVADPTALLTGVVTDFDRVASEGMSSADIFKFLARLTPVEPGRGFGIFRDVEITAKRGKAADFVAWFGNESGATDAVRPATASDGFSLLRVALGVLAAAAVVGELVFLGVSFLLRRSTPPTGRGT